MSAGSDDTATSRRRILAATELLGDLDDATLDGLLAEVEWVSLAGGATLFRQGDRADALYIVVSGRLVAVFEEEDGTERLVREIGRGENVGELAMLTDDPRSATVRAVRDSELARLDRACFERVVSRHPPAMTRLARMLAGWLKTSNRARRSPATVVTIALIPLGRGAPLGPLAASLAIALEKIAPTAHLHRERIAAEGHEEAAEEGSDARGYARTSVWLDQVETAHRFVVYQGDVGSPGWTRRCVRQADRVLLVADAAAPPEDAWLECRGLLGPLALKHGTELALVQPEGRTPSGTALWLAGRRLAGHHHLRLGSRTDVERLARRLTGRSLALVLSGGGARGFAHIGVVRALQEAGIPVARASFPHASCAAITAPMLVPPTRSTGWAAPAWAR